jgi:hypothetical protein
MQRLDESVESMSTSNKRLKELEKILSTVSINESAVRSFIITKDSIYLKKRFVSKYSLSPQFESLKKLSLIRPTKNFTSDSLQKLVDLRFQLFREVLYAGSVTPVEGRRALSYTIAKSDSLTDQIREYIHQSMDNEVLNVDLYQINHKYELETSTITSFLLVTIALFILLLSLTRINTDLNNLKKLNDEMKFLNYTFNNAEKIAGISHWKYNLRTHEYFFSENFYNLLGIDPETATPNIEAVIPSLHPEDRQAVIDAYTDSVEHKTPTSIIYRLYKKNGEMRFIKAIGSFAENSDGELVKIGVNYDITEQYINTVSLEEKNRHLIAMIAELESFNNIVSHDLQEPLRKIQMFISRIKEKEFDVLSENGKEYFNRITVSANRMQTLLIDLVSYSRTIRGDKTFLPVDLNIVLQEVMTELSLNIAEANAMVSVGDLPEIPGIQFQLRQLFINLIANSLKFTKAESAPEIVVNSEAMTDVEHRNGIQFSERQYHKIVLSDNGIGFKQEFADKIFLLFRRLEKDTYQGTGIGLAICKKIVENHNGFIFAEGTPGVGAKFILYFPKSK